MIRLPGPRTAALLDRALGRPARQILPILMYHKVEPTASDPWTVTLAAADEQWAYLRSAGYQPITCAQLAARLAGRGSLPERPILITFDDGYRGTLEHACPLLERHGLKATLFLPIKFLGATNVWDGGNRPLLDLDQLRGLRPETFELGLHSYGHGNYRRMSLAEIDQDLQQCLAGIAATELPYFPALAYPYGAYPRSVWRRGRFFRLLKTRGIQLGLRIGNRLNRLPAQPFTLQRIDVRREETLAGLRAKIEPALA